jgi:hypothetical protein
MPLTLLLGQRRANQQQTALAQRALAQQVEGLFHCQVRALAALGHDRRLDRVQQVFAGGQIVRQRHQRVGAAGIHHDGGLRFATRLQQVHQLAPCLFQPRGRGVGGEHFRGQFQHHHQRVHRFLAGLFDPLPARPQQRQQPQRPAKPHGDPRQAAFASAAAVEQHRVEGDGQDHLPAPGALLPVPQTPEQPAEQRRNQQPSRAKPVRPKGDHRRLPRRWKRWRHCGLLSRAGWRARNR